MLAPEHIETGDSHSFQHLSNSSHASLHMLYLEKSPNMATCLMTMEVRLSGSESAKTEAGEAEPPAAIELACMAE